MTQSSGQVNDDVPRTGSEIAQRILRRNLQNLANKLKNGEVLKPAELQLVREYAEEQGKASPKVVSSKVELAVALGVNRRVLERWFDEPDRPKTRPDDRYDVSEWMAWAEKHGKRVGDAGPSINQLRAKNLILQNQRLEIQLAVDRREFIPMADVETIGAKLGADIRKVITTLHLIAPSIAGCTVPEAETLLREKEVEIIEQLHSLTSGIEDLKTAPSESDESGDED